MSVAVTRTIKASSRASVKVKDSYYTVEYTEERSLPEDNCNVQEERDALWDCVNSECDKQVAEIIKTFK